MKKTELQLLADSYGLAVYRSDTAKSLSDRIAHHLATVREASARLNKHSRRIAALAYRRVYAPARSAQLMLPSIGARDWTPVRGVITVDLSDRTC